MIHYMDILDISRLYVLVQQFPKVNKLVSWEILEFHLERTCTLKFIQEGNMQQLGVEMRLILETISAFQLEMLGGKE